MVHFQVDAFIQNIFSNRDLYVGIVNVHFVCLCRSQLLMRPKSDMGHMAKVLVLIETFLAQESPYLVIRIVVMQVHHHLRPHHRRVPVVRAAVVTKEWRAVLGGAVTSHHLCGGLSLAHLGNDRATRLGPVRVVVLLVACLLKATS